MSTAYTEVAKAFTKLGSKLQEGGEMRLPAIQLAHYPVDDTRLAACLGTLGIPFRHPGPYTDQVILNEKGNETGRRVTWWLGDRSPGEKKTAHLTEELQAAWCLWDRFKADHPLHPLVAMRDALDARAWWLKVKARTVLLPREAPAEGGAYFTDSIHAASILKASGYVPLAFTGHAFVLSCLKNGVHAVTVLETAAMEAGRTDVQWMSRVLVNYSHLVKIAKAQSTLIVERVEDQTLILTADSTQKTRDKFHGLL